MPTVAEWAKGLRQQGEPREKVLAALVMLGAVDENGEVVPEVINSDFSEVSASYRSVGAAPKGIKGIKVEPDVGATLDYRERLRSSLAERAYEAGHKPTGGGIGPPAASLSGNVREAVHEATRRGLAPEGVTRGAPPEAMEPTFMEKLAHFGGSIPKTALAASGFRRGGGDIEEDVMGYGRAVPPGGRTVQRPTLISTAFDILQTPQRVGVVAPLEAALGERETKVSRTGKVVQPAEPWWQMMGTAFKLPSWSGGAEPRDMTMMARKTLSDLGYDADSWASTAVVIASNFADPVLALGGARTEAAKVAAEQAVRIGRKSLRSMGVRGQPLEQQSVALAGQVSEAIKGAGDLGAARPVVRGIIEDLIGPFAAKDFDRLGPSWSHEGLLLHVPGIGGRGRLQVEAVPHQFLREQAGGIRGGVVGAVGGGLAGGLPGAAIGAAGGAVAGKLLPRAPGAQAVADALAATRRVFDPSAPPKGVAADETWWGDYYRQRAAAAHLPEHIERLETARIAEIAPHVTSAKKGAQDPVLLSTGELARWSADPLLAAEAEREWALATMNYPMRAATEHWAPNQYAQVVSIVGDGALLPDPALTGGALDFQSPAAHVIRQGFANAVIAGQKEGIEASEAAARLGDYVVKGLVNEGWAEDAALAIAADILPRAEVALGQKIPDYRAAWDALGSRLQNLVRMHEGTEKRLRGVREAVVAPHAARMARAAARAASGKALAQAKATAGPSAPPAAPTQKPLPAMQNNYLTDLSEYSDDLHRQVSGSELFALSPNVHSATVPEVHFANTPDLALGQGAGKGGAILRFRASGIQGTVNTRKPGWQVSYDQGSAELIGKHVTPETMRQNLVSITVPKGGVSGSKGELVRIKRWLSTMDSAINADGSTTYSPKPTPADARVAAGKAAKESYKKAHNAVMDRLGAEIENHFTHILRNREAVRRRYPAQAFAGGEKFTKRREFVDIIENWEHGQDPVTDLLMTTTASAQAHARVMGKWEVARILASDRRWAVPIAESKGLRAKGGWQEWRHPITDEAYIVQDAVAKDYQRLIEGYDPKGFDLLFRSIAHAVPWLGTPLAGWKARVTHGRPLYHLRNMPDDGFRMWMGGYDGSPATAKEAILVSQMGRLAVETETRAAVRGVRRKPDPYRDRLQDSFDAKVRQRATKELVQDGTGERLTYQQFYDEMAKRGVVDKGFSGHELGDPRDVRKKTWRWSPTEMAHRVLNPLHKEHVVFGEGGFYLKFTGNVARKTENLRRMTSALSSWKRGNTLDEAAHTARKWLLDYSELTDAERAWLRPAFAFYTFTRKVIPRHWEAMKKHPGRYLAPTKVLRGLEEKAESEQGPQAVTAPYLEDADAHRIPASLGKLFAEGGQNVFFSTGLSVAELNVLNPLMPLQERTARTGFYDDITPIVDIGYLFATGRDPRTGRRIGTEFSEPDASLLALAKAWNATPGMTNEFKVLILPKRTRGGTPFEVMPAWMVLTYNKWLPNLITATQLFGKDRKDPFDEYLQGPRRVRQATGLGVYRNNPLKAETEKMRQLIEEIQPAVQGP